MYIMTNYMHRVLYVGVTSNLKLRISRHREGTGGKFTARYNIKKLVYYECAESVYAAICREKQIKGGSRLQKTKLITAFNPEWRDLYDEI